MYKFIKLNYEINVSWVADSYQLTCNTPQSSLFSVLPHYTDKQIEWTLDFTGFTPSLLVHNSIIRKVYSGGKYQGAVFYDIVCQTYNNNTYLQTLTSPDVIPNVYPKSYGSGSNTGAFVGEAGLINAHPTDKKLTCRFVMPAQVTVPQVYIDMYGDNDTIPVSHVFAFDDTQTDVYNTFMSTYANFVTPCYSNRFAWQTEDTYLPEHMGFTRVAPTPLPPTMSKLYIGDNLINNLNVGNDPVVRAYFRNELVWQKEVY